MHSGIQLICFDLDDTLWPCMPTIRHAEAVYYQWLADNKPHITQRYSPERLREKRLLLRERIPALHHDMTQLRIHSLHELAEEFNDSKDWIDEAFDAFYQARQQIHFFDDVAPVLKQLKSRFLLASATNGNADIRQTELAEYFDFSVSAAEAGLSKPEPAMFELLQRKSGTATSAILHVGDHPVDDIEGARRAGIRNVWIDRQKVGWRQADYRPDYVIENLYELLPLD